MRRIVDKIGAILALYTFERPEWGVGEVAAELSAPKSSVSEILASLAAQGLLERGRAGRYRLGWRLFALNQVLLASTPLAREGRAVMTELVERHGETAHLTVLERARAVIVEKVQGTLATQILMSRVGVRLPAHCAAGGKALLAWQPDATLDDLFGDAELERFTPLTITDLAALRAQLADVRARGWSVEREEIVPGLCCVAAPVRDDAGAVIGALSLSIPTYRFVEADAATLVRTAAERISRRLGCPGDAQLPLTTDAARPSAAARTRARRAAAAAEPTRRHDGRP